MSPRGCVAGPRRGWAICLLLGWFLFDPTLAPADQEPGSVRKKIDSVIADLPAAGRTAAIASPLPSRHIPQAITEAVAAAGPEFVAALGEYQRATAAKKSAHELFEGFAKLFEGNAGGVASKKNYNIYNGSAEYEDLIDRLVSGENPPEPEMLVGYYAIEPNSFCAFDGLEKFNHEAIILACLRHRRYGEAVQLAFDSQDSRLADQLLTALGYDPRKVRMGAWLAGGDGALEILGKNPSDDTARLLLQWAKLHWAEGVAQRAANVASRDFPKLTPQLPTRALCQMLAAGNAVTPETKKSIADFLQANATKLTDVEVWLWNLQNGEARWLKPLVVEGLRHDRNDVRKMAEQALRNSGEFDLKAELLPSPRYRFIVNGEQWGKDQLKVGPRLKINAYHGRDAVDLDQQGTMTVERDDFTRLSSIEDAWLIVAPRDVTKPASPADPWIRAALPLPPAFGEVTDLRVDTLPVTIVPKFPRPMREYRNSLTRVEFVRDEDGQTAFDHPHFYYLENGQPLVLARVQPGAYWLRVQAAGAALGMWEKILVSKDQNRFEPKLEIGAKVRVAVNWPATYSLGRLDPALAAAFPQRLADWLVIECNGRLLPPTVADLAPSEGDGLKEVLTLHTLPVGKYRVRLRSSDEVYEKLQLRKSDRSYPGWKSAETTFEITARSPIEFNAAALKIAAVP